MRIADYDVTAGAPVFGDDVSWVTSQPRATGQYSDVRRALITLQGGRGYVLTDIFEAVSSVAAVHAALGDRHPSVG